MKKKEAISLSIPGDVVDQVRQLAEKDSRSLSAMVTILLRKCLSEENKKEPELAQ